MINKIRREKVKNQITSDAAFVHGDNVVNVVTLDPDNKACIQEHAFHCHNFTLYEFCEGFCYKIVNKMIDGISKDKILSFLSSAYPVSINIEYIYPNRREMALILSSNKEEALKIFFLLSKSFMYSGSSVKLKDEEIYDEYMEFFYGENAVENCLKMDIEIF